MTNMKRYDSIIAFFPVDITDPISLVTYAGGWLAGLDMTYVHVAVITGDRRYVWHLTWKGIEILDLHNLTAYRAFKRWVRNATFVHGAPFDEEAFYDFVLTFPRTKLHVCDLLRVAFRRPPRGLTCASFITTGLPLADNDDVTPNDITTPTDLYDTLVNRYGTVYTT